MYILTQLINKLQQFHVSQDEVQTRMQVIQGPWNLNSPAYLTSPPAASGLTL